MPAYAYACRDCGHRFDLRQPFDEPALTACPRCPGDLRRVFGAAAVVFRGTGFYTTDRSAT